MKALAIKAFAIVGTFAFIGISAQLFWVAVKITPVLQAVNLLENRNVQINANSISVYIERIEAIQYSWMFNDVSTLLLARLHTHCILLQGCNSNLIEAKSYIEHAIQLNPTHWQPWALKTLYSYHTGNFEAYNKALSISLSLGPYEKRNQTLLGSNIIYAWNELSEANKVSSLNMIQHGLTQNSARHSLLRAMRNSKNIAPFLELIPQQKQRDYMKTLLKQAKSDNYEQ